MTYYTVNATLSVAAWLEVDADSPGDAQDIAMDTPASHFEYDMGTAEVEFNVEPAVEVSR